jgi:xanthine dehydrogenase iron-sulfur cluster and FAD-binding subunit A
LAEACASFGSTQVETMGTIGGNLCNGSPAADTAPVLLALGAQLTIIGAQGKRSLPVEEFFCGPGKTALKPGEILVEITLPAHPGFSSSAFIKESRVASDLAKASLSISITRQNDTISTISIAMGSVAPKPVRLYKAERALAGKPYSSELAFKAGDIAAEEITPIDDNRSTALYRRQITKVMLSDALAVAWQRTVEPVLPKVLQNQTTSNPQPLPYVELIKRGERREIELSVNSRKVKVWVTSNELLLNVLREKLELTGTKYACGIGECGACSVLIDGKPMLSCLILAVMTAGKEITTVEGLRNPQTGALDPLQEAFIDDTGYQCGYCTPGMLVTAKSLLTENPHPSEDDIRHYLRGNVCRCTGYAAIVRSVLDAAEKEKPDGN